MLAKHAILSSSERRASGRITAAYIGVLAAVAGASASIVLMTERTFARWNVSAPNNIAYGLGVAGIALIWLAFAIALFLAHGWQRRRESRDAVEGIFAIGLFAFLSLTFMAIAPWGRIDFSVT